MKITGTVESVDQKHGTSKKGKPWTLSRVKIGGVVYSTFDAPPLVGQSVEAEVEQDGEYWNLNSFSIVGGMKPYTPTQNTGLDLRQKLIVRQNALSNAVATLQGTDPSVRTVLTVAGQFYKWVISDEMPPEEVPEFKVPEPAGEPQPTPPVEAYNDDILF